MPEAPGSGKSTLAHTLATEMGVPAIIRDELKQGMVQATTDRVTDYDVCPLYIPSEVLGRPLTIRACRVTSVQTSACRVARRVDLAIVGARSVPQIVRHQIGRIGGDRVLGSRTCRATAPSAWERRRRIQESSQFLLEIRRMTHAVYSDIECVPAGEPHGYPEQLRGVGRW